MPPPLLLLLLLLLLLVTRFCVRSKKHKTRNSLLWRFVLRDASRVVKQQQQQQQQQRRRRRRGSSSGQLPFVVSGWLLCFVSLAECVCYFCVCAFWLSLRGFGLGMKLGACRQLVWTAEARMGG